MKTGTVVLSAAIVLAAVGSADAFGISPNSLARTSIAAPLNMVAAEPEIVNGETKPRRTREVR